MLTRQRSRVKSEGTESEAVEGGSAGTHVGVWVCVCVVDVHVGCVWVCVCVVDVHVGCVWVWVCVCV